MADQADFDAMKELCDRWRDRCQELTDKLDTAFADGRKTGIEEAAEMAKAHWAGVSAAKCSGVYAAKEITHSIRKLLDTRATP